MVTKRYGAKQRVVTAQKPMKFLTTYGTKATVETEKHAEEREAKRWLNTRLEQAHSHVVKYDAVEADHIADLQRTIKGRDMMAMKPDTSSSWEFTYSGIHVTCGVTRLP